MEVLMNKVDDEEPKDLPPGFRFHPTDEEIVTFYLRKKVMNNSFSAIAIGEIDLNKCEPWDFPKKGKMGEKELYMFSQRDRKYPTGVRTNRATKSGYWKATGKDREIHDGKGILVGMKKTLVFYTGRAPKGEKSNWVMHEFRLEGTFSYPKIPKDEWVVCRIVHKSSRLKRTPIPGHLMRMDSSEEDFLDSPLMDLPCSSFTEFEAMMEPGNSVLCPQSPVPSFPSHSFGVSDQAVFATTAGHSGLKVEDSEISSIVWPQDHQHIADQLDYLWDY